MKDAKEREREREKAGERKGLERRESTSRRQTTGDDDDDGYVVTFPSCFLTLAVPLVSIEGFGQVRHREKVAWDSYREHGDCSERGKRRKKKGERRKEKGG